MSSPIVEHRLPDVPIQPSTVVEGAWETWCHCGWRAMRGSPEELVIGIAEHLEGLWSKAKRLVTAEAVAEAAKAWLAEAEGSTPSYKALSRLSEALDELERS